jgi:hypothetical protein
MHRRAPPYCAVGQPAEADRSTSSRRTGARSTRHDVNGFSLNPVPDGAIVVGID